VRSLGIQNEQLPFFVGIEGLMNRPDRTRGNAGPAIDADVGIDVAAFAVRMEALNRTMFDAVGKQAEAAIVRNDVRHDCVRPRP
jgi:hypothetical protein